MTVPESASTAGPSHEGPADEDLVRRWQAGDEDAFTMLYERHKGPVFRFVYKQLGGGEHVRGQAEDLFQDIWVKAVRAIDGYRPEALFTTWLYTIARNAVLDVQRKSSRRKPWFAGVLAGLKSGASDTDDPPDADDFAGAGPSPEDEAAGRQLAEAVTEIVDELPGEQREVFLLREEQGLAFAEIAAITGAKEPTVKSRMRYALQALAGGLEDRGLLADG